MGGVCRGGRKNSFTISRPFFVCSTFTVLCSKTIVLNNGYLLVSNIITNIRIAINRGGQESSLRMPNGIYTRPMGMLQILRVFLGRTRCTTCVSLNCFFSFEDTNLKTSTELL